MLLADILPTPDSMDFWKFIVSAWALYSMYAKYREVKANEHVTRSGTAEQPLNIAQPLSVREHVQHAEKPEVDKMKSEIATLTTMITSNHADLKNSASKREASIKDVIHREISTITREMNSIKETIKRDIATEINAVYKDVNPLRERIAAVEATLDHLRS